VGPNPSSKEFFEDGRLKAPGVRLSVLGDYGAAWRDLLKPEDVVAAGRKRAAYFSDRRRGPNEWFVGLSAILEACGRRWSYCDGSAVHLDIVACITRKRWGALGDISVVLTGNCRSHFERALDALPAEAVLLFDGKSACNAVAGVAPDEW
jgi:hypothetical protein